MQVVSAKDAPVPTDKNFLCQKLMHLALDALINNLGTKMQSGSNGGFHLLF